MKEPINIFSFLRGVLEKEGEGGGGEGVKEKQPKLQEEFIDIGPTPFCWAKLKASLNNAHFWSLKLLHKTPLQNLHQISSYMYSCKEFP